MIDFSPVYTTGLIVHCKTLEDSIALFEEMSAEFSNHYNNFSAYTPSFLNEFHKRRGDLAAYRLHMTGGGLIVRKDRIDWYRDQRCFEDYVFVEYSRAHAAPLDVEDLGDIDTEGFSLADLFGGDQTNV